MRTGNFGRMDRAQGFSNFFGYFRSNFSSIQTHITLWLPLQEACRLSSINHAIVLQETVISSRWTRLVYLGSHPGGWGYSTKFYTGRLRPEVQPLTLLYTIFDWRGTPFVKMVPLSHTYLSTLHPFSKPLECSYGRTILGENSITGRDVNQKSKLLSTRNILIKGPFKYLKWQISPPFHILQFVKSLPFYIPEPWKRYSFWAEPPRIGHYRECPPPRGGGSYTSTATAVLFTQAFSSKVLVWLKQEARVGKIYNCG